MFCSTIIPTINRPSLAHSVQSVLDQSFCAEEFEVIVVNDSGRPLPAANWQLSPRVQIVNTNHRERSVARNTGAAIARGQYLHFLDDDDLILPGALAAFWSLVQATQADWLYGSYQTVDNAGQIIEVINPEVSGNIFALLAAGEGIPLQASLLSAEKFHAIGGFDADPGIVGVEDRELNRRLALTNNIAHVPSVVACIRIGQIGSSTNWTTIAESDRKCREKALNAPSSFSRLSGSATSDYWRGRVTRAFLASSVWNIQRGNLLLANYRALAGVWFGRWHCLKPAFWGGLRTKVQ